MQDYKARRIPKRRPLLRGRLDWLKRRKRRGLLSAPRGGAVFGPRASTRPARRPRSAVPQEFRQVSPLRSADLPAAVVGRPDRFLSRFRHGRPLNWAYAGIVAWVMAGVLVRGWTLSQGSLERVRVSGLVSLDSSQVVRIAGLTTGMRLGELDPYAVSSRLRQDPRVEAVDARRVYPHTLWIDVRERIPDARVLLDDGRAAVVDPHNVVIRLEPARAGDLPLIRGVWGSAERGRGAGRALARGPETAQPRGANSSVRGADSPVQPGTALAAAGLTRARVFLIQARHSGVAAFDRAILDVSDPDNIVVTGSAAPRLVFPVDRADAVLRVYRQLTGPDAPAMVVEAMAAASQADFRFAQGPDGGRVYLIP